MRRFIFRGRRFQFSLQSVQLIIKLCQLGLFDLQLRGELGLILSQPRFLLPHHPQPLFGDLQFSLFGATRFGVKFSLKSPSINFNLF